MNKSRFCLVLLVAIFFSVAVGITSSHALLMQITDGTYTPHDGDPFSFTGTLDWELDPATSFILPWVYIYIDGMEAQPFGALVETGFIGPNSYEFVGDPEPDSFGREVFLMGTAYYDAENYYNCCEPPLGSEWTAEGLTYHSVVVDWGGIDWLDEEGILLYTDRIEFVATAPSAEFYVTQLTDNSSYDLNPQIHNGQVVWEGYDGNDREIFLWDGSSKHNISNNDYGDHDPKIHNGQVVWTRYNGWYDVFYWDGLNAQQLTNEDYEELFVQIDNGQFVWWAESSGTGFIIFYWDGNIIQQLTDNDGYAVYCQIHNGQVVWRGDDGNNHEIFLWDASSIQNISNNDYDDDRPQIHNGQVVWRGDDGTDWEIFFWNGSNPQQVTNNGYDDRDPQIHNGQVVWEGYDGTDWEIFLWVGASIQNISNNDYDDSYPQIHNGQVVWQGHDGNDWEIFFWNGLNSQQVTNNGYDDRDPQIHNGQVLWEGYDGNDWEIFLATPCPDNDEDGYFLEGGCPVPLDCNDTNENIYPTNSNTYCDCEGEIQQGITEYCSGGIDEDCDGLIDEADPDCTSSCAGTAGASTLGASPVYRSSDLAKHLAYLLLPLGVMIALSIWRRKR